MNQQIFRQPLDQQKTPRQLLPEFYRRYGLPEDGGQSDWKVKVELSKKLYFYIPNFDARRAAVLKHDVHHLVTGYPTTLSGESEISAWEISSGCGHYWAAWLINSQGMLMGIPFNLGGVFRAYVRGQQTCNLYRNQFTEDEFLNMTLGELKRQLNLDEHPTQPATTYQRISFTAWVLLCGVIAVLSLVLLPFLVLFNAVAFVLDPPTVRKDA